MKIYTGQYLRYGFDDVPAQQRMDAIKQAGFDEVMLWWGDEYDAIDGTRYHLFDYATKIGLGCNTCHFPQTHGDWPWYNDERADKIAAQFNQACRECGERGIENLVVHLSASSKVFTPQPNPYGLATFAKMFESAQKYGVFVALENVRYLHYIDYIVEHFAGTPSMKFCFDSGHANCFTPTEDPLGRYGNLVVTTHLHDNIGPGNAADTHAISGSFDQHRLMGEGIVNFDDIFARLNACGVKYYNLESKCNPCSNYYGKTNAYEFMQISYNKLSAQLKRSGIVR